jgi:hypothetical protein
MRYRPRVFSVNDLFAWHQQGELRLNPVFQRRPVWSTQARSYLIDTLLEGYPIPAIQIRQIIDVNEQKTIREVVDGQQRLRAIFDFLEGKFRILPSQSDTFGGLDYDGLDDDVKDGLLDYEVPVAMLSGASDADVLSVFARLNTYTITLNAQEKLNAKYFGVFKQTVYALGSQHVEFFRRHGIFTPRAITRMAEAQLATDLLVAMLKGLTDGRKAIESTYEEFDERFPERRTMVERFREGIDEIDTIFGEELSETDFHRAPLFYSLFLVLYDLRYGLPGQKTKKQRVAASDRRSLVAALLKLDAQLSADEPSKGYARFREAAARQTDNLRPRQIRHETILAEFQKALN